MIPDLHIEVVEGHRFPSEKRQHVITLCNRAFEEDVAALFDTFTNPVHILGGVDGVLVSHALWETRWLQVENRLRLRTAYVEAVATKEAFRGRGYASAIMNRLAEEIHDYELGALSPSDAAFYERWGWEDWRGPLFIRTKAGLLPTPDDEEVMILRFPGTPALNLEASLSAEWREGELW